MLFLSAECPYCGNVGVYEVDIFKIFSGENGLHARIRNSYKFEEFYREIYDRVVHELINEDEIKIAELEKKLLEYGIRGELVYNIISQLKVDLGLYEPSPGILRRIS